MAEGMGEIAELARLQREWNDRWAAATPEGRAAMNREALLAMAREEPEELGWIAEGLGETRAD